MAAVRLGNSFLDAPARGQKVLVIVPHEDDEINVAGSIMYSYVQKGAMSTVPLRRMATILSGPARGCTKPGVLCRC